MAGSAAVSAYGVFEDQIHWNTLEFASQVSDDMLQKAWQGEKYSRLSVLLWAGSVGLCQLWKEADKALTLPIRCAKPIRDN